MVLPMRVIDHLIRALRQASVFNPDVQVAPACILWPDSDRQWEAAIPRLQTEIPELFILGEYAPEKRSGPAIWLRCILARTLIDTTIPADVTPILYLPGVSRQELRAVETCPEHLKPLAELQYRGVLWSQLNAKDWTILAFLKSDQGGLSLDVAMDNETKNAMQLALYLLLDEDIELLKGKRLDKDYFNTLIAGGDPVRDLLLWLDQGDAFRASRNDNEWRAFVEVCNSHLAFHPQNDGVLEGAVRLAAHEGPWNAIWERFCEAPKRYSNIPSLIRRCSPPNDSMFWRLPDIGAYDGWPQWNEDQEHRLREELSALSDLSPHQARGKIAELENSHGARRTLVWVELGESPLARALEHLAIIAERTQSSLAAGAVDDITAGYLTFGWEADNAVLQALALTEGASNFEVVALAIRAVYLPWIEDSARYLQRLIHNDTYPGGTIATKHPPAYQEGECVLFVDGLRFDTAKRLAAILKESVVEVAERPTWAALPSVTATGKAAVAPVMQCIAGTEGSSDFEPSVAQTGQSLKGGYHLKKLLQDQGWRVLERTDYGNGQGRAWCEFSDIDHSGHDNGWKLARHIDQMLSEIKEKILALLAAGWKQVRVVTDHGWLLMPGGLPKVELPSVLTDTQWGRCAAIKPGASTDEQLFQWFWNPNQYFALAAGISCFRRGEEYAHGGLSFQECLTLELTVIPQKVSASNTSLEITDVVWKGLRCTVAVDGDSSGIRLDIRTQPGNPDSSVVLSSKILKTSGTASVVVEDEGLAGQQATIVLIGTDGNLVVQIATVVGETDD